MKNDLFEEGLQRKRSEPTLSTNFFFCLPYTLTGDLKAPQAKAQNLDNEHLL